MSFDPRLLDKILVCTKCRSSLVRDGESLVCVTRVAGEQGAECLDVLECDDGLLCAQSGFCQYGLEGEPCRQASTDCATGAPVQI